MVFFIHPFNWISGLFLLRDNLWPLNNGGLTKGIVWNLPVNYTLKFWFGNLLSFYSCVCCLDISNILGYTSCCLTASSISFSCFKFFIFFLQQFFYLNFNFCFLGYLFDFCVLDNGVEAYFSLAFRPIYIIFRFSPIDFQFCFFWV